VTKNLRKKTGRFAQDFGRLVVDMKNAQKVPGICGMVLGSLRQIRSFCLRNRRHSL
jgi:hypothetical protein